MIKRETDFNASTDSTRSTAYSYDSLERLVAENTLRAFAANHQYALAGKRTTFQWLKKLLRPHHRG